MIRSEKYILPNFIYQTNLINKNLYLLYHTIIWILFLKHKYESEIYNISDTFQKIILNFIMISRKFIIFTIVYVIIIITCAIIAYKLEKKRLLKQGETLNIKKFLNNGMIITPRVFLIGLIFGIILGMMDNISLYFGIEGLGDVLKQKFNMDEVTVAGYSNAYSGMLGITLAAFAVLILRYLYPDVNQNILPVWLDTLGFLIGAILGIYIPKLFFKSIKNN